MTSAQAHYATHLAPIYLWMAGGAEVALQDGRAEIQSLGLQLAPGSQVVDLGAGFGMHAIALAQAGMSVLAIDSSASLLRTLEELRGDLPVRLACDDLLEFAAHLEGPPDAILCMGDTITHLPDTDAVASLLQRAAQALPSGGGFVTTFRDYSVPLHGDQRFIPVRCDNARLLTCFLEYEAEAVIVHDILHERTAEGWVTRVSHYRKLRLEPELLADQMRAAGFEVRRGEGTRGLVPLIAIKR